MNEDLHAKLEFEVEKLNKQKFVSLKENLSKLKGIKDIEFDEKTSKLYCSTNLPTSIVHNEIEKSTQSLAVLKGMGSSLEKAIKNIDSAVAEISNEESSAFNIKGVIRFVQLDEENCAIDGTVDGLSTGQHAINIHEFGDLSDGFKKIGKHFNPYDKSHGFPIDNERHVGDLGNINSDEKQRATFRIVDQKVKLWDVIGRTICISEKPDFKHNDTGKKLACGIIARSANIYENVKKVCLCSGKTLWDERKSFVDSRL